MGHESPKGSSTKKSLGTSGIRKMFLLQGPVYTHFLYWYNYFLLDVQFLFLTERVLPVQPLV